MSPKAKSFKGGSIIYFEGDRADFIYLLKEGKVNLVYNDVISQEEITDSLSTGEFFGVKSGLIHLQREETAKVVSNSIVYEFNPPEFEALTIKNPAIIIKMLKAFSSQLRRVTRRIQDLIGKNVSGDPSDNFFNIGDYYLKNKKYKQAITVYKRYLNYYPNGNFAQAAKKRLNTAQEAFNSYGNEGGPTPVLDKVEARINKKEDKKTEEEYHTPGGGDNDYNFNPSESKELFTEGGKASKESKLYFKAVSYMSQGKYMDAFYAFKIVLNNGSQEEKILANAEIGKCFFNLKKYNECIKHLSGFLNTYSDFNNKEELLLFIGNSYIKIGDNEKAEQVFNNIISLADENSPVYRKAQKALKELD